MNKCDLCGSDENVENYSVKPINTDMKQACICSNCKNQIEQTSDLNINHWRCLTDSMWNENPSVQVLSWRMLKRLSDESWASDLMDMLYLEEPILEWAQVEVEPEEIIKHLDCNGVLLEAGDTVSLIKDLNVKGASFTAKRGTSVRRISLDPYNENHIEGRVNGQKIVILTQYVKKSK